MGLTVLVLWSCISLELCAAFSEKYNILPPIYNIEDYHGCMERNDLFCSTDVILKNGNDGNNTIWELIQDSLADQETVDRNIVHRTICVPKMNDGNLKLIKSFSEDYILNNELKNISLRPYVKNIICLEKEVKISIFDIIFLLSFLIYIFLVLYSTMYDWLKRKYRAENAGNKFLISFSVISNWEKLCNVKGNEDFNRLKSIQGIRCLTMLLITAFHSRISYSMIDTKNPELLAEMTVTYPLMPFWQTMEVFLVKIFFLFSSWIVTFQIHNFYKNHGEFTLKHVFIMSIRRYFRIGVCTALLALLFRSTWPNYGLGPLSFRNGIINHNACKQNMWKTLLFISNFSMMEDMCVVSLWYLSADFQYYVIAVFTMYLILKFKLNKWKVISMLLFISYAIYGVIIYRNEMDIVIRFGVKDLRRYSFQNNIGVKTLYTSSYSSWSTSLIGMLLAFVYIKIKNLTVNKNLKTFLLWLIFSFGLSGGVIFISSYEFEGMAAVLLGPLVKPLFCLGIGIAILGMSQNIGGIVKRICENKYLVLLSNFSFSIYVFQVLVVFNKGSDSITPLEISTAKLIWSIPYDIMLSIVIGIIGAVLFEQPGINLQNIFSPQLPSKKQKE